MFSLRMLAMIMVMSAAVPAGAQRIEIPVAPSMPVVPPTIPTIVVPPPPPTLPLAPDLHVHMPQQCCHLVCAPDYSCPAGALCPQRCNNVCAQC